MQIMHIIGIAYFYLKLCLHFLFNYVNKNDLIFENIPKWLSMDTPDPMFLINLKYM